MKSHFIMNICILLVIAAILPGFQANAEEFDLKSMSLDDLATLRQSIDGEISARLAGVSLIYPSTYLVGKDIREGAYIFTGIKDDPVSNIDYYANADDYENRKEIDHTTLFSKYTWSITLEQGMVLEIIRSACEIQEAPPMLYAP